jgi:riboflavin kinase / FMN adenylyltransferase
VKIYHSIKEFPSDIDTIITIGTFDGVHKGHKEIVGRLNSTAKKEGLESVLLTFYPHPRHVLFPDDQKLKLINTIEEKTEALRKTGLQHFIIQEFDVDFSRIKSVNFIRDLLVNKLNMKRMVVGYDHHFGKNREGTFENLLSLSELYDFKLDKIAPQNIGDITISSTKIRNAIIDGDIEKANSYLSCNFSLSGVVEKGNGIGSSINFPTANIKVENKWKILPKDGVYAVKIFVENQQYFGMLNIGNRPTIADDKHVVEVHIFDFNSTIYNLDIQVEFIKRIRSEKKFNSLEELQSQLEIDESKIKALFNLLR